jgi:mannitol operon transcriptional antiterminator
MVMLTTRQRDLLRLLLAANAPQVTGELAAQMNLTPRQVSYGLKGLDQWLAEHDATLNVTPGVGVSLDCPSEQQHALLKDLSTESDIQLVLSLEQRQQLLAIILIVAIEPVILYQLQQLAQVSRTTITKDLDAVEVWLDGRSLTLERRPNYGIWVKGSEQIRRQALAALVWGDTPFGPSLIELDHNQGVVFSLVKDANLLPLVQRTGEIVRRWDTQRTAGIVAYAEAQLDGRFTDDAVLHLALSFAIQNSRVQQGQFVQISPAEIDELRQFDVWPVAGRLAHRLAWPAKGWPEAEVAHLAMHLLAAPRNDRWPGDLDLNGSFASLLEAVMEAIAEAYQQPGLSHDRTLRDGIATHIVPAFFRQRFQIWMPATMPATELPPRYSFELNLARRIVMLVENHTAVSLPEPEVSTLALLLRAAHIRTRPNQEHNVIVVCPSGMATAQLLVARLTACFPRLGQLKVLSLRELSRNPLAATDIIITTVPLPEAIRSRTTVIQVHPLLLPEDIEAITQWLA